MNMDLSKGRIGFEYKFEILDRFGRVRDTSIEYNLIPDEGRDYLLTAALLAGSQFSNWFIGLYDGAYSPVAGDTMATFPASASELTTEYSEATRQGLTPNVLAAGVYSNVDTPAVFTFASETTVRGGFISSGSVKGGTTGVLLSAVLASSPKLVEAGESLRVITGLTLITA
jgi:hypothetical protein